MNKLLTLIALTASLAAAQTTYTNFKPSSGEATAFVCDASGHYIETSFYQFTCRGIFYVDPVTGAVQAEELWTTSWYQIGDYSPIAQPVDIYHSHVTGVTEFTEPSGCALSGNVPCATPGTFAFDWSIKDANGMVHTGSHSGTWDSRNLCGAGHCWYHPVLLTNKLTINN